MAPVTAEGGRRKDSSSRSSEASVAGGGGGGGGGRGKGYGRRDTTLAPEEVLFRRRRAPQRYAERDVYFANEALPNGVLPESDLLQAVHGYASRFYEALGQRHGGSGGRGDDCFVGMRHVDERSMDETALLAFGILIEEAGREVLGERGDLVFTEGLVEDEGLGDEAGAGHHRPLSRGSREGRVGFEDAEFWKRRMPKRRKLVPDEDAAMVED